MSYFLTFTSIAVSHEFSKNQNDPRPKYFGRIRLCFLLFLAFCASLSAQNKAKTDPAPDRLFYIKFQDDLSIYANNGQLDDHGFGLLKPFPMLPEVGIYSKLIDLDEGIIDEMRYNAQMFWDEEVRKNPVLQPGKLCASGAQHLLQSCPLQAKTIPLCG